MGTWCQHEANPWQAKSACPSLLLLQPACSPTAMDSSLSSGGLAVPRSSAGVLGAPVCVPASLGWCRAPGNSDLRSSPSQLLSFSLGLVLLTFFF